ncbi:13239_t:CDS:1, partial [Racocetra persica]
LKNARKTEKIAKKAKKLRRMEKVRITNLRIIEKSDVGGNYYYVIFNNDEPEDSIKRVFFAFANRVKRHWEVLSSSYDNLKEVEI